MASGISDMLQDNKNRCIDPAGRGATLAVVPLCRGMIRKQRQVPPEWTRIGLVEFAYSLE